MGSAVIDRLRDVSRDLEQVAVDPSSWSSMIDRVALGIGARGGAILSPAGGVDLPISDGTAEAMTAYHTEGWWDRDTRRRAIPLIARGGVATDGNVLTRDEAKRDPLYASFLPRFDLPWWACVGFSDGVSEYAMSLFRSSRDGPFEACDTEQIAAFALRLTEVATLSRLTGAGIAADRAQMLERIGIPALALDRQGRILAVNAPAEAAFDPAFGIRDRRLVMRDERASAIYRQVTNFIRWLIPGMALPTNRIVVRRIGRSDILLRLHPIGDRHSAHFGGARLMLTFKPIERPAFVSAALIAEAFDLTAKESELAAHLARGLSPERIASAMLISIHTVRVHLRSVYAKTDTSRQADLVALLGSIAGVP